jgi:hypothetical protein
MNERDDECDEWCACGCNELALPRFGLRDEDGPWRIAHSTPPRPHPLGAVAVACPLLLLGGVSDVSTLRAGGRHLVVAHGTFSARADCVELAVKDVTYTRGMS